ncbi:PREDICTED: uncharacterized protein LOC104804815 [Tarenaya hassleriana]|uniref:uncharacterized protein LOC104804815 n=1 Tax=Tarenaya hassleriana TaxID=28532 RepID=UPI00053C5C4F|nr:PREDICTED: uncharacterized protein LOC104804815 [Tarenaya hassleriana]
MDADLWGPPTGPDVGNDSCYVQTVRGCGFYFDRRLDVIEENALNEISCVQVLRILMEKEDAEIDNHEKVSILPRNDDTCYNVEKIHDAIVPEANTSSTQSAIDEEASISNLSDAQTAGSRDSSYAIEDRDPETRSKLRERTATSSETVQPAGAVEVSSIDASTEPFTEKGSISSGSVSTVNSKEVEEHSCLSLDAIKTLDPIKQEDTAELLKPKRTAEDSATNISRDEVKHLNGMQQSETSDLKPSSLNKPSEHHCPAAKSKDGSPGLRHLVSKARQRLREKTNALNEKMNTATLAAEEDEERLKDDHQTPSLQNVLIATEPFTMDCLLEMCDGEDKGGETPLDKKQKRSQAETGHGAGRTGTHDELIKNLILKPAEEKTRSNALLVLPSLQQNPSTQQKSNSSNHAGPNKSFIRDTKQNITQDGQGEPGNLIADPGDEQKPMNKRKKKRTSESSKQTLSEAEISSGDLNEMKTNDLKAIAKALKVTHYYKLRRNDLLQQLISRLNPI